MPFQLDQTQHGVKVGAVKNRNHVTKSALASLRLAMKAYFKTYYICHKRNIIGQMNVMRENPFYDECQQSITDLCENIEYQELYIQTVFHFHHFFELLLKDILASVHKNLALKISLDGNDSVEILNILLNTGKADISLDNTAEFNCALERVYKLKEYEDGPVPIVVKTIDDNKQTLKDLNLLRNRAWHKGIYILRITELDQFISQNVLPLVERVIQQTEYNKLQAYWKYTEGTKLDPIVQIILAGQSKPINYKRIAFFKTYGLACYNYKKTWNLELDETRKKTKAIVNAVHDLTLEKCYVCNENTLIVSTISDHETDQDGNLLNAWWNTTAAECLNCSLSLFPDVGEPKSYGVAIGKLWKSGDYEL